MRRPIQIQLLLPTLAVVALAIVLASGTSAYLGTVRARRVQEEHLRQVVDTLRVAKFPLSEPVLRQMSGLSGAEFIYLDEGNRVRARTLDLDDVSRRRLDRLVEGDGPRGHAPAEIALAGRTYLAEIVPVPGRPPADVAGRLLVLYSEDLWSAAVRHAGYTALAAGILAALAVVVVTAILAERLVRPIRRLGDQAATIARGDFTPVAVAPRDDEIRDLALAINRMTERLAQYGREVRRSEQVRTLGQLGAGMAHQLRNAATGGRMAVELHQRDCQAPGGRESLEVALRQLRLMESYLQRFLTLSQPRRASRETVPLGPLLDEVAALVRPACLHARIELAVLRPPEGLQVRGDPEELRQLAINLVLNAVDAATRTQAPGQPAMTAIGGSPPPAKIAIELARLGDDRGVICVRDSGPGPSEAVVGRLFEPFVTGKPDGTGLGLFVARQIAEDHGGAIRWDRRDGMTEFIVELPLYKTPGLNRPESNAAPA
ncbi:MAG: HAMP domain-containing sensor histidine kinase [Thermoguttaceae bacterium]|jgi:signal transduction histidine kinase